MVVPSLSVLARISRTPRPAPWRLVALAAPMTQDEAIRRGAVALLARRYGLPALPGAAREAAAAGDRLGGRTGVFIGEEATETRFRELVTQGARVLHVAAHTLVDEGLAAGVAIFLAEDARE